jgi:hypothetical protein
MDDSNLDHKLLCVYCFDILIDTLKGSKKIINFPDNFKGVIKFLK